MNPNGLLSTPPLPPKLIILLNQMGIFTVSDLAKHNPCRVFLLLKSQQKGGMTLSVFWKLVALVEGCLAHELSETQRLFWQTQLREFPPVAVFPPETEMMNYMQEALNEAQKAVLQGEIPVGAVVVYQNEIIARAHNRCVAEHSACHHAELLALMQASQVLQKERLVDCDLYVSLEPCAMCAGAILHARIKRLIFGAHEPRMGSVGSIVNLLSNPKLNAHTAVYSGILAEESAQLLKDFFVQKRSGA